jgi:Tfp pilus assembly protein PilF
LKQAGPELERIALDHPSDAKVEFAAELSLDGLQILGQYDELAALAQRLQGKQELQEKLGDELVDVHEAALLAAAHRESKGGNHIEAARRYLSFAKAYPQSSRIDLALFNGAAELTMQGRLSDAVATRSRLMTAHADSPLAKRAREQQLSDLVHLGRFQEATPLAADIAGDTEGKDAATHLHDAITVAEAAGNIHGADALRERYLKEYRRGPDAMGCALALADRAKGCEGQTKAAREALSIAPDAGWRAIALERLARTEDRCHEEGKARYHASAAVALATRIPAERADALDAIASAELLLVESDEKKYRELPVAPPYERTLPRKLAALKTLDDRLAKVVAHGRASAAVCALVQSGVAYGELANTLGNAKAPRSFTQEQREMFHEQLSDKSQPLLDHARETLLGSITRAREARTEPACLAEARKQLVALWPERFGPQQEAVARLGQPATKAIKESTDILTRAPDAPAAWLIAARAEIDAHRPQGAYVLADRIQKEDYLYPQALELKAQAFDQLGQGDAALGLWSRLSQEYPERSLAHRILADRAMANRDFEGARTHLTALRRTEEKNPDIALNLGVALHALGDLAGAEKALREATAMEPKKLEASLDLGLLLCGDAGRPKEGIEMLEQFHQSGGRAPDAHRFESALGACRALAERRP